MNPMRKAFHWNAPQIFFAVHVMFHVPNTDFFNIVHLSAIVRHVKCTFLDCFYIHLQLERAISVFILISLHIFVCKCFSKIVGEVIWHGRWAPFHHGEEFHWYGPKIIYCSMYTSVSPPKHFFNIINFVGIASHTTFTFPSHYSINFHVYMLISDYILIFLHIFFIWECLE